MTLDGNGLWKYIAISAVSASLGLLVGQFTPNRNIVTREDLVPVIANLNAQQVQLQILQNQVSELTGELRAKKELR